jgi:hypothetical protein
LLKSIADGTNEYRLEALEAYATLSHRLAPVMVLPLTSSFRSTLREAM